MHRIMFRGHLSSLPPCLSELYKPECLYMQYSELMKRCEHCNITVTQLEAESVELATKLP